MKTEAILLHETLRGKIEVTPKLILKRLNQTKEELLSINLGATAIGTEINAVNGYRELAVKRFSQISGYDFESASDLVDGTRHIDVFANIHSVLKTLVCLYREFVMIFD